MRDEIGEIAMKMDIAEATATSKLSAKTLEKQKSTIGVRFYVEQINVFSS